MDNFIVGIVIGLSAGLYTSQFFHKQTIAELKEQLKWVSTARDKAQDSLARLVIERATTPSKETKTAAGILSTKRQARYNWSATRALLETVKDPEVQRAERVEKFLEGAPNNANG